MKTHLYLGIPAATLAAAVGLTAVVATAQEAGGGTERRNPDTRQVDQQSRAATEKARDKLDRAADAVARAQTAAAKASAARSGN